MLFFFIHFRCLKTHRFSILKTLHFCAPCSQDCTQQKTLKTHFDCKLFFPKRQRRLYRRNRYYTCPNLSNHELVSSLKPGNNKSVKSYFATKKGCFREKPLYILNGGLFTWQPRANQAWLRREFCHVARMRTNKFAKGNKDGVFVEGIQVCFG